MNHKDDKKRTKEEEEYTTENHEPRYSDFPLICPSCGRTFYQDYDKTEKEGMIVCPYCGARYQ